MRLRDLPTEAGAAEALLRAEELDRKRSEVRGDWQPFALAGCAVATLVVVLLPVSTPAACSLWRAEAAPAGTRALALTVPFVAAAVVLAERMLPATGRTRLRGAGAIALGFTSVLAWLALLSENRAGCSTVLSAVGVLILGGLATATATLWARRPPASAPRLIDDEEAGKQDSELNQPEIRTAYLDLRRILTTARRRPRTVLSGTAGTTAGLLLLSTVAPWRELVDPAALHPIGITDTGLVRTQLWEMSYAKGWPLAMAATALVTIGAAVAMVIPIGSMLLSRVRVAVLRSAAAGCGALVVSGLLVALLPSPARLTDGVGYRAAAGAWLALPTGVALLALGGYGAVRAVRRRHQGPAGWIVQVTAVVAAAVTGIAAGTLVPDQAGPAYRPDRTPGVAHRLFDLDAGQLTDRMGLRLTVTTSDPLTSVAPALDGSALDGTARVWLMSRTGTDESTVFALVDGIALPRTKLHHGSRQPVLLGVSGDRLVLLSGSAVLDKPWALLAVPLRLPIADVSLEQRAANGDTYVTPGVGRLAAGSGRIHVRRTADGAVLLWDDDETWHIPATELATDDRLELDPEPGGAGNPADITALGDRVWPAGSRGGLFVARSGRPAQLLTGTAPGDCPVSSDPAASGLPTDRFAIDARGNVWLAGDEETPAVVVPPDGVTRVVPGIPGLVVGVEARPDGTVLLSVSPGGGDQIYEIDGAATAASAYELAPPPEPRCAAVPGIRPALSFDVVRMPEPRVAGTPVAEDGGPGLPSASSPTAAQLMLDTGGELVRRRLPESVSNWSSDGRGGVWWGRYGVPVGSTDPRLFTAVHLPAGRHEATAITYPVAIRSTGQRAGSAAYGDRNISTLGDGSYGLFGPGTLTGRLVVPGQLRTDGLALTADGRVAMVVDGRLISVGPNRRRILLLGGSKSTRWPIAAGIAAGVSATSWSTDGQWFGGPDGRLWGYDGRYVYRVDGPSRVTVLGGLAQGIPAAADRITVIGRSLYFESGASILRVVPR